PQPIITVAAGSAKQGRRSALPAAESARAPLAPPPEPRQPTTPPRCNKRDGVSKKERGRRRLVASAALSWFASLPRFGARGEDASRLVAAEVFVLVLVVQVVLVFFLVEVVLVVEILVVELVFLVVELVFLVELILVKVF